MKLIILRDIVDVDDTVPGGKAEESDSAGGKILTPYLRDVSNVFRRYEILCSTATPMYNSYKEIIFMLNMLL
jgi:hypothetical protein